MVQEEKAAKLVKKRNWKKLREKYLTGDKESLLALAKACAADNSDDCCNLVTPLLDAADEEVQLAAIETLGKIGTDHVIALLRQLFAKTPESNQKLRSAILASIEQIRKNNG